MPRPAHSAALTLRASSGSRMNGASDETNGRKMKPISRFAMALRPGLR